MPSIDEFLQEQVKIIDRVGWSVVHVVPTSDDPPTAVSFSYTVGLTAHDHPELLVAGLPAELAHGLLNDLARRVYDKAARFSHGELIGDVLVGYDAIIVDGPPNDDLHPGAAFAVYGRDKVRLHQLVWPDEQGRFPWETGYGYPPHAQPLIAHPQTLPPEEQRNR
ncbi:DUF4262 domain-containing protein [Actinoplanes aureus]|uniref:DUF4262 domain-containing protein n=1 Tax=Actinoplanes aureus TaxID=2792083 RepID=A0A931CJG6_9ACTN|nr:DUF4262 domain-containing protein [Actinoplanes aureus]MBG0568236.1 DUF4262 domain-containing protein [Actinoplanes aureus]